MLNLSQDVKETINQRKEPDWLINLRLKAIEKYLSTPNHTERDEEWRYTKIQDYDFSNLNVEQNTGNLVVKIPDEIKGKGVEVIDLPTAVNTHSELIEKYLMKSVDYTKDKINMLHAALWTKGILIHVPEHVVINEAFKINFSSDRSFLTHSIIIAEADSQFTYYENHNSENSEKALRTSFVEIHAKENSIVNFNSLQNLNLNSFDFSVKNSSIDKSSTVNLIFGYFGSKLFRLRINSNLNGEGSSSYTRGIFRGVNEQHSDITTNAYHNVPHTTNDILVKGILDNNATSVYRGLIKILEDAQQTNSYLSDHTLKLSKESIANSIPSLEIDANDVKASHSATISQVDDQQIFYLMTRGLSREQAEEMIVTGFLEDVLKVIKLQDVKNIFIDTLEKQNDF